MNSESATENQPNYLTVAQLAQRLQVSESTIYGWVDRDYIPFLMAGDLVRFDPTSNSQLDVGRSRSQTRKETRAQGGTW